MNNSDCSSEALKHSCENWTLALSATTIDIHFLWYNIWETLPIFFSKISVELSIAPRTKQEMAWKIVYLVGLLSKILDTGDARKIQQLVLNVILSWAAALILAKKTTNIYIWWFRMNFFEEATIRLTYFAVLASAITSFFIKRFIKTSIILRTSTYRNRPLVTLVWNLPKDLLKNRCYRAEQEVGNDLSVYVLGILPKVSSLTSLLAINLIKIEI